MFLKNIIYNYKITIPIIGVGMYNCKKYYNNYKNKYDNNLLYLIQTNNNVRIDKLLNKNNVYHTSLGLNKIDKINKENINIDNKAKTFLDTLGRNFQYYKTFGSDLGKIENDYIFTTPLMYSIIVNNKECIKKLFQREDIDIFTEDEDGNSALHYCIILNRDISILKLILKNNMVDCVINDKNNNGNTPLMEAIITNNPDIEKIKLLYQTKSLELYKQDNDGNTALMKAIKIKCDIEIFKILIQKEGDSEYSNGSVINRQNNDGNTALMLSLHDYKYHDNCDPLIFFCDCKFHDHNIEKFKLLLQNKDIDLNIKNHKQQTALDIAINVNSLEAISILKKLKI